MIEKECVPYFKQCNTLHNYPYPGMLPFLIRIFDTIELTYKLSAPKQTVTPF